MTSIKIRSIRAIKQADIQLGGITVLGGENGCGKSTVSKLVYHTLFTANNFDEIVEHENRSYRASVLQYICSQTLDFIYSILPMVREDIYPRKILSVGTDVRDVEEYFTLIREFLKQTQYLRNTERYLIRLKRYFLALRSSIPDEMSSEQRTEQSNIDDAALGFAFEFFKRQDYMLDKHLKNRPLSVLFKRLNRALEDRDAINQDLFDMADGGVSLFNRSAKRLGVPFDVRQVFYIDTPWLVDGDTARLRRDLRVSHRFDLLETMRRVLAEPRADDIVHSIIGGFSGIENDKTVRRFEFLRDDGSVFDLFHCATGIKSFSIIQMLFVAGKLGKETLLILDEPEAHLHPKWTFEYAKLICKLHQEHGVRFLISTHSPDMVQSLNAIAQHRDMSDEIAFYCAKPSPERDGTFLYEPCGNDISPIFESFNSILNLIGELDGDGTTQG